MARADLNRRPRLLFLAHAFPPCHAIGSVRAWNISKYLTRMGWDVTVVTPPPSVWGGTDDSEEVEASVEREGIHRILAGHQGHNLCTAELPCWRVGPGRIIGKFLRKTARYLVNNAIGWVGPAERACSDLSAHAVDVILATGSPFLSFRLAKRLSTKLGRPYVLDYRDPWSGNPHKSSAERSAAILEERALLAECAAVTIVSRSWGVALDSRFGLGSKLHIVTNGYDPEELTDIEPSRFDHFALVYTGNFYPPKRVISPVMAALRRLRDRGNDQLPDYFLHYYGSQASHVRAEASRFGITDRVILHDTVPRKEALCAIKGSGAAVVITSIAEEESIEDKGIVTGKVFEALGIGAPILLLGPPGSDAADIVEGTGSGRSFVGTDVEGVVQYLIESAGKHHGIAEKKSNYSWPIIASKLDLILRDVISKTTSQSS